LGVSLLGIAGIVLSDLSEQNWQWAGDAKGDIMAAAGATLFSLDSVYQERLVKQGIAPYELLAYLSLFAAPITVIEGLFLELKAIQRIHTYEQIAILVLFACSYSAFYILMPHYIKAYGATLFNMSLITGIIYTLLFAVVVYNAQVKWLYLAGFIVTLTGLILYNLVAVRRTAIRTPPLLSSRTSSSSSNPPTIQ
jgi:drug/metabolite transporter (DMT)-like permease